MDGPNLRGTVDGNGNYGDLLDDGGSTIRVNVVHGSNQLDLVVPSQFTFGDLKKCITQGTGLEPKEQILLFRGKEKDDQECLQMVGVKDNAKVLLMQEPTSVERKLEEVNGGELSSTADVRSEVDKIAEELGSSMEGTGKDRELEEMKSSKSSRSCLAVAEVSVEVDKLSEKVAALEAVVHGGTQVGEKEFIILPELLMWQLLKFDSIEAEGEGKVQRKLEVRRVQTLVDRVDSLKARNSTPLSNSHKNVTLTTEWETFDSEMGSPSASPPYPSSAEVSQDWEHFD